MATSLEQTPYEVNDFSGGRQNKTTKFQTKENEQDFVTNASYKRVGGIEKIAGYTRLGNTITTSTSSSTSTSTTSSSTSTSTSTSTSSSTSTSTSSSSTTTP